MSGNPNNLRPPWKPGESGNPGGRPPGYSAFRRLCRSHSPKAIEALVEALECEGERVSAAKVLLEFGFGKAEPRSKMSSTTRKLGDAVPSAEEAKQALEELRKLGPH